MLLTISYCQELGIYTISDGNRDRTIAPCDFAPGGRLDSLAPVFDEAREAVESGRAVLGINVEV